MIKVDLRQFQKLSRDLEAFKKGAFVYATRNALNNTAFAARKEYIDRADKSMTMRNTWTARGTLVDKATGTNVAAMEARMGSTRDYMAEREAGGTETARGRHGIALPTSTAAGQGTAAKRTRPVRRSAYLSSLKLGRRPAGGSQKQRNAVAIAMARRSGTKTVFLDLGKRRGIFKVDGGKRRARLRMLYDLSHRALSTKPIPTMAETLKAIERVAPDIALRALQDQCRRHRILGF